jgi:hypothetical protein
MGRTVHVLRPFKDGKNPSLLVFVQACAKQEFLGEADEIGQTTLARLHMRFFYQNGNELNEVGVESAECPYVFMSALASYGAAMNLVHLYSINAREVIALCGLWDRVLDGKASVSGADPRSTHTDDSGYCVLEAPPTIVQFRIGKMATTFVWLDPANFGANLDSGKPPSWLRPESIETDTDRCALWYADWRGTCDRLKLGSHEHTAAAQAQRGFRQTYMSYPIYVHDSRPAIDMERAALYGGRCECKFIGTVFDWNAPNEDTPNPLWPTPWKVAEGSIYQLDVNSLYAAMAGATQLPTRLDAVLGHMGVGTLKLACRARCVIAEVEVDTDKPVVPVRHEGLTIFPVGFFRTTLCGPELELAIDSGADVHCIRAAVYAQAPIYRDYVLALYRARMMASRQDNRELAQVIKALLNASFGRWAQRTKRWKSDNEAIAWAPFAQWWQRDRPTGKIEQWRSFAWQAQRLVDDGEPNESFPAISAYIASYARVRLWDLIQQAGPANVYYYDTDSIWCNQLGYDRLKQAGELSCEDRGRLKLAGQYGEVEFVGWKRYVADGKLTMAGLPEQHRVNDGVSVEFCRAPAISHFLARHEAPGIAAQDVRARIRVPYQLGKVNNDGTVMPLEIEDQPCEP